jgi:pyrimidine operon attenuation protein / uracil phosphoribosyltransferase
MQCLLDEQAVALALDKIVQGLAAEAATGAPFAFVGIRSRGVPLAQRLVDRLAGRLGAIPPAVGMLDITLYRDDLLQRKPWPVLRGTAIPFHLDDRRIVLVDDVIFSGRTAHAALAALNALGRPACVRLAVLIDRGHRQFPIQPDYVGQAVAAPSDQRVYVRLQETDGVDEVVLS